MEDFGFIDPGYFGIRRFPYSLDRNKNGLSFRHISDDQVLPFTPFNPGPTFNLNSEVHNAGEVWAQMLWESYNVLIDEHGFVEAQRRMTDYVVAGLLLTPPEATYTEGRDAMLAAASALDTDDMLLMAAAFAGRGAGTCAVSPPNTSASFIGVVESGTVAAKLGTSTATLIDDGASCDRDGFLDPGESGTLHITVANSGVVAAEEVIARATTTTPGVILGKPVAIGTLAPLTHVDVAIPVRLAANATTNDLDIRVNVTGDAGCNTGNLLASFRDHMSVDEVAASRTFDAFETRQLGWTLAGASANALWSRVNGEGSNHQLFGANSTVASDTQVVSPPLQVSTTTPLVVRFLHAFDFETAEDLSQFFDGSVIEVSTDGGMTFRDVRLVGADPEYPVVISPFDPSHPLRNRPGFGGRSEGFPALRPVTLNFGTQFAGQAIRLRFRAATDFCCKATGWLIDDVVVTGITNTPFPGLVPEPSVCTAPLPSAREAAVESAVIEVRHARRNSLDSVPVTPEPL
jgi:large repetitive protein